MTKTIGSAVRVIGILLGIWLVSLANEESYAQEWRMRQVEPLPPPAADTNNVNAQTLQPSAAGQVGQEQETTDLGPQIPLRRQQPPLISLYSDSQYLFDSNVALTPHHETSDGVFFETLGAALTPHLADQLSSAIYARQQFVLYDQQVDLNFYAQTAGLSLAYPLEDWFTLYGGFAATRLFSTSDQHEFYKEFDTQLGLWHGQSLGHGLSLYYGYQFDWLASSPSDLTEVEDALYGGINWQIIDQWTAQFLYRFRVRDYLQVGRTDFDHLVSLAVTFAFDRYASIRAYASYANNDSNKNEFDYDVANVGCGVNLAVRF